MGPHLQTAMRELSSLRYEVELTARSARTRQPVTGTARAVVSLTSYGRRLERVHLTIESIGRGTVRPSAIILWVDDAAFLADPSPGIRRLIERGLQMRATPDLGPHKKYFPYVSSAVLDRPLVTADDDVYYPAAWLQTLLDGHREHPEDVVALRARWIGIEGGKLHPYASWQRAPIGVSSPRVFPTGVGGVLYPVGVQELLRREGQAFLDAAPRADDIWLHANTIRSGRSARQLASPSRIELIPVRGAGGSGLWESNVAGAGNDQQLAATYTERDLALIESAGSAGRSR